MSAWSVRVVMVWLLVFPMVHGAGLEWRGMTVSCQTFGAEWATPEMRDTLGVIQGLGCNAFAIHPYAGIQPDGGIRFDLAESRDNVVRPARWAREMGMTMMLAPHLAYWGTPFSWRGEIRFDREEEWDRFFSGYTRWITGLAAMAEEERVPVLCFGLEYSGTMGQEKRWREVIRQVRQVYRGQLTYGANWNDYREVPFWDALDAVGVLAYFPLSRAKDGEPSEEVLRKAWRRQLEELSIFARKTGRPVIFTELGYNESSLAAAHPWAYETGGPNAAALQERCMAVALEETARTDFLRGIFLWKWFPPLPGNAPDPSPENFDLRPERMRRIIRERWKPADGAG